MLPGRRWPLFRLLHLALVLLAFRMPVSALWLVRRPPLVLRSHFVAIPALRWFILPFIGLRLPLRMRLFLRSRLFLPTLRLRIFRLFILVLVLSHCGKRRKRSYQLHLNMMVCGALSVPENVRVGPPPGPWTVVAVVRDNDQH